MVKQRKKHSREKCAGKGFMKNTAKARKINVSTPVETCTEQYSCCRPTGNNPVGCRQIGSKKGETCH